MQRQAIVYTGGHPFPLDFEMQKRYARGALWPQVVIITRALSEREIASILLGEAEQRGHEVARLRDNLQHSPPPGLTTDVAREVAARLTEMIERDGTHVLGSLADKEIIIASSDSPCLYCGGEHEQADHGEPDAKIKVTQYTSDRLAHVLRGEARSRGLKLSVFWEWVVSSLQPIEIIDAVIGQLRNAGYPAYCDGLYVVIFPKLSE